MGQLTQLVLPGTSVYFSENSVFWMTAKESCLKTDTGYGRSNVSFLMLQRLCSIRLSNDHNSRTCQKIDQSNSIKFCTMLLELTDSSDKKYFRI